jgi:signal transduction histidine kinase
VLSVSIGASVTRPVRRLAEAMRILSARGSVKLLPEEDGGELRTLARGFNEMAARLQANARDMEVRIERATRALTAQKDAAEQATEAKSRFIAAASHDLRQPLHAIGLFTGTLQRRTRETDLEPWFAISPVRVAAMERLFDGLLDLSRLDAGTVVAEPRPFPLERLFAQLHVEFADAAAQKGCACACAPWRFSCRATRCSSTVVIEPHRQRGPLHRAWNGDGRRATAKRGSSARSSGQRHRHPAGPAEADLPRVLSGGQRRA